jgi:hypothetical protein
MEENQIIILLLGGAADFFTVKTYECFTSDLSSAVYFSYDFIIS